MSSKLFRIKSDDIKNMIDLSKYCLKMKISMI